MFRSVTKSNKPCNYSELNSLRQPTCVLLGPFPKLLCIYSTMLHGIHYVIAQCTLNMPALLSLSSALIACIIPPLTPRPAPPVVIPICLGIHICSRRLLDDDRPARGMPPRVRAGVMVMMAVVRVPRSRPVTVTAPTVITVVGRWYHGRRLWLFG